MTLALVLAYLCIGIIQVARANLPPRPDCTRTMGCGPSGFSPHSLSAVARMGDFREGPMTLAFLVALLFGAVTLWFVFGS
jgi:hypothetical protein